VLKLICQKLGVAGVEGIFHLSYGMVELPQGKMKSREGTVVDADDLLAEMIRIAKQKTEELGKVNEFSEAELQQLYRDIGIGALKFFLLRVDPKKKIIFNPQESIDFHGFTGPFVQYTHARIKSILKKIDAGEPTSENAISDASLTALEKQVALQLEQYPSVIEDAAAQHDPSKVAIYIFNLAKIFNSFYSEHSIVHAETEEKKQLRLQLATLTATVIASGLGLLGINAPERM
jgi:arginyl-tRNA synthetase